MPMISEAQVAEVLFFLNSHQSVRRRLSNCEEDLAALREQLICAETEWHAAQDIIERMAEERAALSADLRKVQRELDAAHFKAEHNEAAYQRLLVLAELATSVDHNTRDAAIKECIAVCRKFIAIADYTPSALMPSPPPSHAIMEATARHLMSEFENLLGAKA